jgi:protease-4
MSSEYPESTEAQSRNTSASVNAATTNPNTGWERQVLSDLVQANLKEQQAARRWKNGLRVGWLLFWIVVMWQILSHNQTTSNITTPHTALVNIKGEIADGTEASAENIVASMRAALHGVARLDLIDQFTRRKPCPSGHHQ